MPMVIAPSSKCPVAVDRVVKTGMSFVRYGVDIRPAPDRPEPLDGRTASAWAEQVRLLGTTLGRLRTPFGLTVIGTQEGDGNGIIGPVLVAETGPPWRSMTSADDLLRSSAPIPIDICLEIAWQAANGVAMAYRNVGVGHGTLRPGNLLLTEHFWDRSRPQVLLLDLTFGQRRTIGLPNATYSLDDRDLDAARYMSPLMYRYGTYAVTPTTDAYALGAVLYHLITGRPWRAGSRIDEVIYSPPPTRGVRPYRRDIPEAVATALDSVIAKATAPDTNAAYRTVDGLCQDIRRVAAMMGREVNPVGDWIDQVHDVREVRRAVDDIETGLSRAVTARGGRAGAVHGR